MNISKAVLVLLFAAILEAGGDAIVRKGLQGGSGSRRIVLFALGAAILFAYGYTVNAPKWNFGRLLGVYVVFFFLVAQVISTLSFGQPPTRSILVGGALILIGGAIIAYG